MADLRFGRHKVGFSIRSFMAFAFTVTCCWLTAKKIIPVEAFLVLAGLVIKAYFDKPGEADSKDDNPHNGDIHESN